MLSLLLLVFALPARLINRQMYAHDLRKYVANMDDEQWMNIKRRRVSMPPYGPPFLCAHGTRFDARCEWLQPWLCCRVCGPPLARPAPIVHPAREQRAAACEPEARSTPSGTRWLHGMFSRPDTKHVSWQPEKCLL